MKKVPIIRKIPIPVRSPKKIGTKIININKVHLHGDDYTSSSMSGQ